MPKIPREQHAVIARRTDVEGHKVAEVAAAYGCTPANIYAILAKQRRQGARDAGTAAPPASQVEAEADPLLVTAPATATDLFGALPTAAPAPTPPTLPLSIASEAPAAKPQRPPPAARPVSEQLSPQPRPSAPVRLGRGLAASKPATPASPRPGKAGYALLMRTSDG